MAVTRARQMAVGGLVTVGLTTLFTFAIDVDAHSSPATHAPHPDANGSGVSVVLNPRTGKVVALGSGVTVTLNPKTGRVVSVSSNTEG